MTKKIIVVLMGMILMTAGLMQVQDVSAKTADVERKTAVYLGVKDYGAADTDKAHRDSFLYRFKIGGKERVLSVKKKSGYAIQNALKEGYTYKIRIKDDTVVAVKEVVQDETEVDTVVSGKPGKKTLKNFLTTAMMPVGTTLYIYGGGWDWQDEGSAIQTKTIGVSPDWVRFFDEQDANYTYRDKAGEKADPAHSYYPYGGYNEYYYAGLDCSGYLGWIIYNTFETEDGQNGYVGGSTGFARRLSENGWGTWTQAVETPAAGKTVFLPGDIMSINGHVWISLGTCEDGSVLILHSTPTDSRKGQPGGGVQLSALGNSKSCAAYKLAKKYMKKYYPRWYERYEVALKSPKAYTSFSGDTAGRFTWTVSGKQKVLKDPDGLQKMQPEEVLKVIFDE